MKRSKGILNLLTTAGGMLIATSISAQTFTRITDPSNPLVTDEFESGGGSWGDFNNDGFLDVFVAHGNLANQQNGLYLNNRNGGFVKVTTGSVITDGGSSIGGTWGDFNNDGDLDLFVTNRQPASGPLFGNFLYVGNGDTSFVKVTTGNPATDLANSNSSSWVDINNDGHLDLFVVNFQADNFLYYNGGPPTYTFTRADTGTIVQDGSNFSIAGVWADYNNDRKPDFFLGNAGGQNDYLFTNHGNGYFVRTTLLDARATLGASWGDFNNDGYLDLFAANFLGQNNILYRNSGPPDFSLVRIDTGIVSNDGGNSIGSVWADVDNDGDLDLFVANDGGVDFLYLNSGPPAFAFSKVTTGEIVNTVANSFGCSAADYDNDGALDLFVANRLNQRDFLYMNNGNSNSWLTIKCVGTASNTSAIGTKVKLKATVAGLPAWQMREVAAQTGYNSQNLLLHVGFGNASVVDSITVEWPSGQTDYFINVLPNRIVTIIEGGGLSGLSSPNQQKPEGFELHQNYPNPFNPSTTIRFRLQGRYHVLVTVHNQLGQEIRRLADAEFQRGTHFALWDGLNKNGLPAASGIYYVRARARGFAQTIKALLVR